VRFKLFRVEREEEVVALCKKREGMDEKRSTEEMNHNTVTTISY